MDKQKPPKKQPAPTIGLSGSSTRSSESKLGEFGDYELLEEIATGGMGVVYKARQRGLNRVVALKMIKSGQLAGEEEVRRFYTEAEAAAQLRHPNIVAVHEVGEVQGQHFFSMDYVQGTSLKQRAQRGAISPDLTAEYIQTIATAVDYAHRRGIVHRDLKPANVLIDSVGQLKITDFGLAKRLDADEDFTAPGSILGTPSYMSPEQAAGKQHEIGPPTDIYSLGAVLYELLTGRPPFKAKTPVKTLWEVMESEPKPPRLVDAEIPRDLEIICLKCLAKEPKERYRTAGKLADDLGRYLHGEPILARPSGASGGPSRLTWLIVAAIVAALVFALVGPMVTVWLGLPAESFLRLLKPLDLVGAVFLRLLKMIVVPLVMFSVMSGILGLGDVRRLGRAGMYTVTYYLTTTMLAAVLGLVLVNVFQPGLGAFSDEKLEAARAADPESYSPEDRQTRTVGQAIERLVLLLFTDNLFGAMAEGQLLPLIVFSVIFAAMLTTMGRRAETLTRLIVSANHALLNFVILLMKIAPIGIFCLVAARFGKAVTEGSFFNELRSLAYYVLTVITGLGLHFFLTLPLILFLFTRRNPFRFMLQMSEALLTAFSTASSSATLPVSLECAEKHAKVSRRSAEFVLPLGSTVNMDGTALYEACAAMFIAQAFGVQMGPVEQVVIFLTATLAAIGAAGIPEAGLVTLVIVLNAVGLPLEGIALILSVDWFLDRFRTTVNVFGDAVGAATVEKGFRI